MKIVALVSFSVLLFLGSFEIGLRLLPGAIPLGVLMNFEPGLRSEIAGRRNLQRRDDTVALPRSDGGPEDRFWVYKPGVDVVYDYSESGLADSARFVDQARMDGQGFCNEPADRWRQANFDVVAIGDSFAFCTTVEPGDAWPALLEDATGASTYNLGLPGRGVHEYVLALERFGLEKRPKVVVMNIYEGNDLRDAWLVQEARVKGPSGPGPCPFESATTCERFRAIKRGSLGRHSYLLNLVIGSLWKQSDDKERKEVVFGYDVTFPDGTVMELNSKNGDKDEVQFARRLADGLVSPQFLDDALDRFAELAESHGFAPVLVYTPSAWSAYSGMSRFHEPALAELMRGYSDTLRAWFAETAATRGMAHVDATPALRSAAARLPADRRLYFSTNVHLTGEGHAVVAEEVAKLIAKQGLIREAEAAD